MCEKELHVPNGEVNDDFKDRSLLRRMIFVVLIAGLSYFAIWMQTYALNEWMQHTIKVRMFSNTSLEYNTTCGNVNKTDVAYERYERVQQDSAHWQMYNTMATKASAFLPTLFYTLYTDYYGRKYLFILSTFSICSNIALNGLVMYLDGAFIYLVAGNALYGLTGTSYSLLSVMYSYAADVTRPGQERSVCIFMCDVAISVGGTVAGLVVGFYIERYGYVLPMFTAALIQLLAMLMAIFCLRESLTASERIKRPPILTALKRPFSFYASSDFRGKRGGFLLLLGAFVFADMIGVHRKSIEALYQLGAPFCWKPSTIGIYATVSAFGQNVIGIGALKLMQKRLSDLVIAMVSLVTNAASFVTEGLASSGFMLFFVALPAILNNISSPLIRSLMSAMTSKSHQGALFASIAVAQTICSFVTAITDNSIYAATLPILNGFVFLVLAGYCLLSLLFLGGFTIFKARSKVDLLCEPNDSKKLTDEEIYNEASDRLPENDVSRTDSDTTERHTGSPSDDDTDNRAVQVK